MSGSTHAASTGVPNAAAFPTPGEIHMSEIFNTNATFESIGLRPEVLKGITEMGFEHPTHVQAQLIPLAIEGKDILGQSKTGTGKTAAFGLPLLHNLTVDLDVSVPVGGQLIAVAAVMMSVGAPLLAALPPPSSSSSRPRRES